MMRLTNLTIASIITTGLMILFIYPVSSNLIYPPCPWYAVTGTYCPGCGSLRGVSGMLQGDILALWDNNPLAFILMLIIAGYVVQKKHLKGIVKEMVPSYLIYILAIIIVLYWVTRNIIPALAPVPIK